MAKRKRSETAQDRIRRVFGKNLKYARRAAGYTSAQQFAQIMGIEAHTYRHWEAGRSEPNLETIIRLCTVLKVTPNDLMPEAAQGRQQRSVAASIASVRMTDPFPNMHSHQHAHQDSAKK